MKVFKYHKPSHGGIGDISPIIFQIIIYFYILAILNYLIKYCFQKNNQELIYFYWGRASFLEFLVFDYQLSNNLSIRDEQQKLIKQKTILQNLMRIINILILILIFISELNRNLNFLTTNNKKWMTSSIYVILFLLYFYLQSKLYFACVKKQTLDEEYEALQTQEKPSQE
ncbi:hypothetical protein ['Camptotheca acuminata' phytoplasma]|uniref:hypothetical protein n=1 Tax='Camptotheca acuminata' phytoplasma TaxID=3239192 RepID=UPI00351AA9D1